MKNNIIALFNPKCISSINFPGGVFDGCGDRYVGEYEGFKYESNWKGVSDRYSKIVSPEGERVAFCDTAECGFWVVDKTKAPKWLWPLDDERLAFEAEEVRKREAMYKEMAEREKLYRQFLSLKRSYKGTRLSKFLVKKGREDLLCFIK